MREGGAPGPSVVVVAGIHGDEPAPPHAVRRLETITLRRGRLILVPEVNPRALARGTRFTPGARFLDLNRNFPTESRPEPRGPLARQLWRSLRDEKPDWVIDVHEGLDVNRRNPKSVGSSVTWVPHPRVGACSARLARHAVTAVNRTIADRRRHFTLLVPGPEGSFARSATETLGLPSLVLETTRVGQPLELRVRQHETMLRALLERLGLTSEAPRAAGCVR